MSSITFPNTVKSSPTSQKESTKEKSETGKLQIMQKFAEKSKGELN